MQDLVNFKILVLGSQGVGKSCLIMRYLKGQFCDSYNVTVGVQFASKMVQVDSDTQVRMQIWDTAGQQFFRALVRSFYQGISAVFLVYAIDKESSLNQLRRWVDQVRENSHQQVVMFLIGARSDCEQNRQVSPQRAATFLKQIEGALFVETSAKTGQNIELIFKRSADHLYKKFKGNKAFRDLVQPEKDGNLSSSAFRGTRGTSIVLKKQTNTNNQKREKKKCCE